MTDRDSHSQTDHSEYTPAKTDEPITELLFGVKGLRMVHVIIYSLVFGVTTILADIVFAVIRTVVLVALDIIGIGQVILGANHPIQTADATLSMMFTQNLFNLGVIVAAVFVALIITLLIFYWNEIRYRRGEWLRTFL